MGYMTVHKSKGLQADNVIVIGLVNERYGFPNTVADDPILELLLADSDRYDYAEERRLFYVALTRTRNRVWLVTGDDSGNPGMSRFVDELRRDYEGSAKFAFYSQKGADSSARCPRCGGVLVKRTGPSGDFVGCSGFPFCDKKYQDVRILTDKKRCPVCGGWLTRRINRRDGKEFYGCTNYPKYCTYTMNLDGTTGRQGWSQEYSGRAQTNDVSSPNISIEYQQPPTRTAGMESSGRSWSHRPSGREVYGSGVSIEYEQSRYGGRQNARPRCPSCGAAMTLRSGPHGRFYGCTRFPSCMTTLDYKTSEDDRGKAPRCPKCGAEFEHGRFCPGCGAKMIDDSEIVEQAKTNTPVVDTGESAVDKVAQANTVEAETAEICRDLLTKELEETGMYKLYSEIELPLTLCLKEMEENGVYVLQDELKAFGEKLDADINILEKEIYAGCGEEFNINSPKQLGTILFEKLKLPYGKKTKTGYSTNAEVLEKLKLEDPVVEKILSYRTLTKLKSTYAEGLKDYIDADGRIRTSLNQTVTATGRLSSTEPNLQNIPIRESLGRELRKIFVAGEGKTLVDADYSQIELRILASLSGDERLIGAYRDSADIHQSTASAVFKVPMEQVTKELRSRAKAVNFGIVYGISSFGLGTDLNIPRKEAEQYIKSYFETYPGVKKYLDDMVSSAAKNGYSTTMFGRRRPIPELSSSNFMQRSFGERIAMNSPVQGSAADIIKIAMLKVYKRLKAECPEAKLLLQIHDELLVEVDNDKADLAEKIMIEEMQSAADLPVSLEVGTARGKSWYEAH